MQIYACKDCEPSVCMFAYEDDDASPPEYCPHASKEGGEAHWKKVIQPSPEVVIVPFAGLSFPSLFDSIKEAIT